MDGKLKTLNTQYNLLRKWVNDLEGSDESLGLIEAQRDAFDNAINVLRTRADNLGIELKENYDE